ncbi:MAG TPA: metallophosphoesterase, partial [Candidatus Edwardsbacteria bacterium]|nr:metallophosphoesterase [Candidatus Edwardsbacteria bacterium]
MVPRSRIALLAFTAALLALAAAPLAAQPFRFVTTCDAQGNSDSQPLPDSAFLRIVNRINTLNPRPDFWIFGGDAFYSATDSATCAAHWQTFLSDADPLSDIQLYVAIGNHDINNYGHYYGSGWHGDGSGPFKATFPGLPQNGPAAYLGVAYSFRYGNSIFCVVNANLYSAANYAATFKVDAPQRTWLS